MKKLVILLAFLAGNNSTQVLAQTGERNTLLKNIEPEFSFVDVGFYTSNYSNTPMYGGSFGFNTVFKSHFSLGFDFDFTGTQQVTFPLLGLAIKPRFSYSGFLMTAEYLFFPHRIVNFSVPIKAGLGYAVYNDYAYVQYVNYSAPAVIYKNIADDLFFVVEPGINVHLNLFKNVNIFVGAGYRLTSGVNTIGTDADFTQLSVEGGVRIIIKE